MSHAFAVFLIWILSLFGIQNCEPIDGLPGVGICIEEPAPPPPALPPGAGAVAHEISNGF
jgi:hypothetical protein